MFKNPENLNLFLNLEYCRRQVTDKIQSYSNRGFYFGHPTMGISMVEGWSYIDGKEYLIFLKDLGAETLICISVKNSFSFAVSLLSMTYSSKGVPRI